MCSSGGGLWFVVFCAILGQGRVLQADTQCYSGVVVPGKMVFDKGAFCQMHGPSAQSFTWMDVFQATSPSYLTGTF